jgi:hypothetical protein
MRMHLSRRVVSLLKRASVCATVLVRSSVVCESRQIIVTEDTTTSILLLILVVMMDEGSDARKPRNLLA